MHFLVMVVGPHVERQLALYGEQTRLAPYRAYVPAAEIAATQRYYREHPKEGLDPDDVAAHIRRDVGDLLGPDGVGRDERGWYYWSTENWKARWDYWTLSDREPWSLLLRSDRLHAAQALLGDIDLDAMRHRALAAAEREWDEWEASSRDRRNAVLSIQAEGFTRVQFLMRSTWRPTALVIDGLWHERGDRGLRADVSDQRAAEWNRFVDEQFARLPADTLITCVDCHH
ncbi:hypothetical protein [Nocardia asteroides]|uniref:hypothetical protein n=1 Tax=Nocardia asteroides TaxID=1824 RepID=UPI001E62A4FB|nr:hypothetical protein [Nocardia asteroides]UGT59453.1 hypothetical protein LTT61_19565 [Nocardia asteroides]